MNEYSKELEVAKDLARKAGVIMKKYFFAVAADQGIERKEDGSPVTAADKQINSMVIKELSKHFDYGIIGEEESTAEYGMGKLWFCDPIDGTNAFVWGVPTCTFSLGLIVDGVPVLGVVYDPFLDLLYYAVKGSGAYCNDQPIHVSSAALAGGVVVVTSSVVRLSQNSKVTQAFQDEKAYLAAFSGAVYKCCSVAKGKFVGYFEDGVSAHDLAAAHVIVEEAGGRVTAMDGKELDYSKPFSGAVVSNAVAHDQMVEILN